jgi:hypothetical protein
MGEQNNESTKILWNRTCLSWLHSKNFSWQHSFRLYAFCSAPVITLVIMLNGITCEKFEKWETCPLLKRTDRCCEFSWSICDKTATLLDVSRVTVSEVM